MPRPLLAAAAAVLATLVLPSPGAAHEATAPPGAVTEGELRSFEAEALGPGHAAEHAAERDAAREWRALAPSEQRAEAGGASSAADALTAAAGPPELVGEWTSAPFAIPNFAIHSVVLPTGKVLFWGYPPLTGGSRANVGQAAIWDPALGTGPASMRSVPPPEVDVEGDGTTEAAPIYCSGQSFLPSGAVLVTGGNLIWSSVEGDGYTDASGHPRAFTFDPFTETWTEQPAMRHGRWYPSQVELADGRTAIVSGYDEREPGGQYNNELEVFTPSDSPGGVGTMERFPGGDRQTATYPHLFTVPSGEVALAGAASDDSSLLDTGSFLWSDIAPASRERDAGTAVLMPGGPEGSSTIAQLGGFDLTGPAGTDGVHPATETSEAIDVSAPAPAWTPGPSLNLGRSSHNTVLLPDGSMVTVGGGRGRDPQLGSYVTHDDGRLRQVELYDPASGTWRLGPAQQEDRAYHSTAVLLPDGRVMSAGDDLHPVPPGGGFSASDTAEIYSPPYLFEGPRPAISSAPRAIKWGRSFEIGSPSPSVARAVLMAPAATTHGVDMSQRHVELELASAGPGRFVAQAPPSPGVAPPGYYMLFLLSADGVPSVASWVKLSEKEPDPTGGGAGGPAAAPSEAGPGVQVALARARHPKRALVMGVTVDRAASVAVSVRLPGPRGRAAARERALEFAAPGTRRVTLRLGRRRGLARALNLVVAVWARDRGGNETTWRRAERVPAAPRP